MQSARTVLNASMLHAPSIASRTDSDMIDLISRAVADARGRNSTGGAEWFNALISGLWPWINVKVGNILTDPNGALMRLLHGIGPLKNCQFIIPSDGALGKAPLYASAANIHEPVQGRGIQIDAQVDWTTDWSEPFKFTILGARAAAELRQLNIKGVLTIRLEPLHRVGSPIGGIMIYFRDKPRVAVDLVSAGVATNLIRLMNWGTKTGSSLATKWRSGVRATLADSLTGVATLCSTFTSKSTPTKAEEQSFHNQLAEKYIGAALALPNGRSVCLSKDREDIVANRPLRPLGVLRIRVDPAALETFRIQMFADEVLVPFDSALGAFTIVVIDWNQPTKFFVRDMRLVVEGSQGPRPLTLYDFRAGDHRPRAGILSEQTIAPIDIGAEWYVYTMSGDGVTGVRFRVVDGLPTVGFLRLKLFQIVMAHDIFNPGDFYQAAVEATIHREGEVLIAKRTDMTRESLQWEPLNPKKGWTENNNEEITKMLEKEFAAYKKNFETWGRAADRNSFLENLMIQPAWTVNKTYLTNWQRNAVPYQAGIEKDMPFPVQFYAKTNAPGCLNSNKDQKEMSYAEHVIDFGMSMHLPVHSQMFDDKTFISLKIHKPASYEDDAQEPYEAITMLLTDLMRTIGRRSAVRLQDLRSAPTRGLKIDIDIGIEGLQQR